LTDDNWKAVNSLPALPFLDSEYLPFFCGCFLGSIAIFGETKVQFKFALFLLLTPVPGDETNPGQNGNTPIDRPLYLTGHKAAR
ncbi:MAG: hypothetical protein PVJ21_23990, partial [Anaerolineales bacterium]